ncbi:MAG TPA: hypothetical protein VKU35_05170 [Candidatus Limnocylindria bacterium]|nr:hypothetical protein [Candidatus Limnocylindria bacterium]
MTKASPPDRVPPPEIAPDGPTQLVPDERGELIERLSGATATVLLIWLMGIGAATALLGVWIFAVVEFGRRLGAGDLFGGPGLYTGLIGATGPTVLWLTGRAQGHDLGWFLVTSAKIGSVMLAVVLVFFGVSMLVFGLVPGPGAVGAAGLGIGLTLVASVIWALATWSADRYIAQARIRGD